MLFQYDDGGRKMAGYKGEAGDCVCRAIAIASERPYRDVYFDLNALIHFGHHLGLARSNDSARDGIHKDVTHRYLEVRGWEWVPTMRIGQGCRVHLRDGELPMGRLIVKVSKHLVAVVDGVIHDTYDPSRDGTRCVYGYWKHA